MFWIGLIVGFIIGGIAWFAFSYVFSLKMTNMSWNEFEDSVQFLIEAGNNRESKMTLHYNDEDRNVLTFEEK